MKYNNTNVGRNGGFNVISIDEYLAEKANESHYQSSYDYEVLFIEKGYIVLESNRESIRINSREILVSLPNTIKRVIESDVNIKGYYVSFSKGSVADVLDTKIYDIVLTAASFMQRYPLRLSPKLSDHITTLFRRVTTPNIPRQLVNIYLQALLFEVNNELEESMLDLYPMRYFTLMHQFTELIETEVTNNRSLEWFSCELSISPNHLNKVIKATTGKCASALLMEHRISYAKKMLSDTTLTISEVSHILGFYDASYFAKRFKHSCGISPKEFRRQLCL
ncbi:MAG: helix-turn-helix domain-containing protein [Bacteroidales bacterium]